MAQRREGEEDPHLRRVEDQLYIAMKKWVVDQLAMTRWQSDNPTSLSNHCAGVITNKYICRHFSYSANFTHMLCTWSIYSEWIFTVSLQSQDICKEGLRASLVELYLHFTFRKYNIASWARWLGEDIPKKSCCSLRFCPNYLPQPPSHQFGQIVPLFFTAKNVDFSDFGDIQIE